MTKNKIKDAAITLFSVNSYEETTLAKIAEKVGIKTPSIYAFYSNKEDLFLTALHEVFSHYYQHIQHISDSNSDDTAERKLFTILQEMHHYHLKEEEKTNFYRRYMLFPPKGLEGRVQEEFIKSDRYLANLLNNIFTSAIKKGEVREIEVQSLIANFLCLMDGLFTQLFYYPRDIEEIEWRLNTNWKIYWEGISK